MSTTPGPAGAGDVPNLHKGCLGGLRDLLSVHLSPVLGGEEVGAILHMLCRIWPWGL